MDYGCRLLVAFSHTQKSLLAAGFLKVFDCLWQKWLVILQYPFSLSSIHMNDTEKSKQIRVNVKTRSWFQTFWHLQYGHLSNCMDFLVTHCEAGEDAPTKVMDRKPTIPKWSRRVWKFKEDCVGSESISTNCMAVAGKFPDSHFFHTNTFWKCSLLHQGSGEIKVYLA